VLCLIQTKKMRRLPIILAGGKFWDGMLDWFRTTMTEEKMISPGDVDLMQVIDDPDEIVAAIFDHYQQRGFSLSPQEREAVLSL
jgi:predicted Rossmann-fold nucleotide-binding protein